MSYEYEAFFSYKRDPESDDWHAKVKTKLEFWLKQELKKPNVRIFFDTEEIRSGMRWRQKLATALKQSRCIVCVWSPLYFQSKWCVSEWKTFLAREEKTKKDLVMPASYFDGETFPPQASARQFPKFNDYASTMPSFWTTALADTFERERLRPFAHELAAMITNAPEYNEDFPISEVPDDQVEEEKRIERPANA